MQAHRPGLTRLCLVLAADPFCLKQRVAVDPSQCIVRHVAEASDPVGGDGAIGGVIVDTPLSAARPYVEIEILSLPSAAHCCVGLGASHAAAYASHADFTPGELSCRPGACSALTAAIAPVVVHRHRPRLDRVVV